MLIRHALRILITSLLLTACDNPTEKNQASLIGHWELTKALRNQRETGVLAGITFHFGPDGQMSTTLPVTPTPMTTPYVVEKNHILQRLPQPLRYHIQSLSDSTLVLTLEMSSVPFELHLRRTPPPPPPATDTVPAAPGGDSLPPR
ncbi:MAG TPA: hypothetical protein PKD78_04725 [Saprospiraceae bacterium]|nr:hypothetical protein [Saprospiraceae bacterium]HNG89145.1 hypothetical protein [Saprospiraceae bacterium]